MTTAPAPTNGHKTPTFDPFAHLRDEGEQIIELLMDKAEVFAAAVDKDAAIAAAVVEAKRRLDIAEAEVVMEASMDKENPYSKVAKTSKEHGYALTRLLESDPNVAALRQSVHELEAEAKNAAADKTIAETRFSAIRYVARLKSAIIESTVR